MKKLGRALLWTVVYLLLLFGVDQILVRIPLTVPVFAQGQAFYVEFRERLTGCPLFLPRGEEKGSPPAKVRRIPAPGPKYVYVDGNGAIQFADSLKDVPASLRRDARPLGR